MSEIIKTLEDINPLLIAVREYYKNKKDEEIKEKYENNSPLTFGAIIGGIISFVIFVVTVYLWLGFHNKRKESLVYKIFSFIVAILFNWIYILGNLLFNDNTVDVLKQIPKFKFPVANDVHSNFYDI